MTVIWRPQPRPQSWKITIYDLLWWLCFLGLGIATLVLSFLNRTTAVNILEVMIGLVFAAMCVPPNTMLILWFLLQDRTMGLKKYRSVNPQALPWLFDTDRSQWFRKWAIEFINICITVSIALFLIPLGWFRYKATTYIFVPERGPAVKYASEYNPAAIIGTIMAILVAYALLQRSFLWLQSSNPLIWGWPSTALHNIAWLTRVLFILYIWVTVWMSFLLWLSLSPEATDTIFGVYSW